MKKVYNFSVVSLIQRDRFGYVSEIIYKGRVWNPRLIRGLLANDQVVQKAALLSILDNHNSIKLNLFSLMSDEVSLQNKNYLIGFHPRHNGVRVLANVLRDRNEWRSNNKSVANMLKKELPLYTDQIWFKMLSNLNINFRSELFTPSRPNRRKK
jgi:hypothetical protein